MNSKGSGQIRGNARPLLQANYVFTLEFFCTSYFTVVNFILMLNLLNIHIVPPYI